MAEDISPSTTARFLDYCGLGLILLVFEELGRKWFEDESIPPHMWYAALVFLVAGAGVLCLGMRWGRMTARWQTEGARRLVASFDTITHHAATWLAAFVVVLFGVPFMLLTVSSAPFQPLKQLSPPQEGSTASKELRGQLDAAVKQITDLKRQFIQVSQTGNVDKNQISDLRSRLNFETQEATEKTNELAALQRNMITPRCIAGIVGRLDADKALAKAPETIIVTNWADDNRRLGEWLDQILQLSLRPSYADHFLWLPMPDYRKFPDVAAMNVGSASGVTIHGSGEVASALDTALGVYFDVHLTERFVKSKDANQDAKKSILDYYHTQYETPLGAGQLGNYKDVVWLEIGPGNPWAPDGVLCDQ